MRKMKDSGVEWIGEIPRTWTLLRIKHCTTSVKDGTHGTFERLDEGELLLSSKNVFDDGIHIAEDESYISEQDYTNIVSNGFPRQGDILLSCVGTIGRTTVFQGDRALAFQRSVAMLRPRQNINSEYLKFALQCPSTLHQEQAMLNQTAQAGLYLGLIADLQVAVPFLEEQHRIADFLDTRCVAIDDVRSDTEREIALLKEYKQALITQTVTRGLNPDASMKDSGVEWIGEIPEEWEVVALKYLCDIKDECRMPIAADKRSNNADVLYDYYGASGVIDKIDGYTIDDHVLLVGEDGANLLLRNLPLVYEVNGKAWINNHAHIIKPHPDMHFNYVFNQLESVDLTPYITGSAQPKLYRDSSKFSAPTVMPLIQLAEESHRLCLIFA